MILFINTNPLRLLCPLAQVSDNIVLLCLTEWNIQKSLLLITSTPESKSIYVKTEPIGRVGVNSNAIDTTVKEVIKPSNFVFFHSG